MNIEENIQNLKNKLSKQTGDEFDKTNLELIYWIGFKSGMSPTMSDEEFELLYADYKNEPVTKQYYMGWKDGREEINFKEAV